MAYKDSLFRSIFGNEKSALALYNAVHGTSHDTRDTEVVMNTLNETLWTPRKNDLSFLINRSLVVLKGYAYFVFRVRAHEKELAAQGKEPGGEEAMKTAIKLVILDCKNADLLRKFWENRSQQNGT